VAKIEEVDLTAGSIVVERRAEGGVQVLKTKMPALITMLEGTNEIRRGTMKDALRAAREEIVTWSAKDAGIEDIGKCGLRGSPTVVKRVFAPTPRAEKAHFIEVQGKSFDAAAESLVAEVFTRQPGLEEALHQSAAGL
jgi:electron transfer flavoprotein beta subunit